MSLNVRGLVISALLCSIYRQNRNDHDDDERVGKPVLAEPRIKIAAHVGSCAIAVKNGSSPLLAHHFNSSPALCCSSWCGRQRETVQQSEGFSDMPVGLLPWLMEPTRIWAASVLTAWHMTQGCVRSHARRLLSRFLGSFWRSSVMSISRLSTDCLTCAKSCDEGHRSKKPSN